METSFKRIRQAQRQGNATNFLKIVSKWGGLGWKISWNRSKHECSRTILPCYIHCLIPVFRCQKHDCREINITPVGSQSIPVAWVEPYTAFSADLKKSEASSELFSKTPHTYHTSILLLQLKGEASILYYFDFKNMRI